jgi:potassium voltage-gated channel Eag-related subfamily H protein 7
MAKIVNDASVDTIVKDVSAEDIPPKPPHTCKVDSPPVLEAWKNVASDPPPSKKKKRRSTDMTTSSQERDKERDKWVINPDAYPIMQYWDFITLFALLYVAVVTPCQVALAEGSLVVDGMYLISKLIDLIFLIDAVLQFFIVYREKTRYGYRIETNQRKIALHYIKGWFTLDLVSVFPFEEIGVVLGRSMEGARLIKIVRLLRLIKLARVMRASRLFHRWETSMAINYNNLKFWFAMVVFMFGTHWIALCWVGFANQISTESETWLFFAAPMYGRAPETAVEVYLTALYWSVTTVTSIGYGDIYPVNYGERVFCTVLMFASQFIYAFSLGEILASLQNSDIHTTGFRQLLDDLNFMMVDQHIPTEMRRRLRAFFFQIKDLKRIRSYQNLIEQMSPSLQGEVALEVNEAWMSKVWYFRPCVGREFFSKNFLADLAVKFRIVVYVQRELVGEAWTLYIIHRGLAMRRSSVLSGGSVWGDDFILSDRELLDLCQARALTFLEANMLPRAGLAEVVENNPDAAKMVRNAVVRIASCRGVIKEAKRRIREDPERYGQVVQVKSSRFMKAFAGPKEHLRRRFSDSFPLSPCTDSKGNLVEYQDIVRTSASDASDVASDATYSAALQTLTLRQEQTQKRLKVVVAQQEAMQAQMSKLAAVIHARRKHTFQTSPVLQSKLSG